MNNTNKQQDIDELLEFAKQIQSVGRGPRLSKAEKRDMLSEILPRTSLWLRMAPAMTAVVVVVGLGVFFGVTQNSKPGQALYDLKRAGEDVRSAVQPSYDDQLLIKRNQELQELQAMQAAPEVIKSVEQDKKTIETRIESRRTRSGEYERTDILRSFSDDDSRDQYDECVRELDALKRMGARVRSSDYEDCKERYLDGD